MILAVAGLKRLGLQDRITDYLSTDTMLPAVGQGALGIEIRADDARTRALLTVIDSDDARAGVLAERALLRRLEGGCQVPIGAHGILREGRLHLVAFIGSLDGRRIIRSEMEVEPFLTRLAWLLLNGCWPRAEARSSRKYASNPTQGRLDDDCACPVWRRHGRIVCGV